MNITLKRMRRYWTLSLALVGLNQLACTTDESDPGPEGSTESTGGSDGGNSGGTGGTDGTPSGTVCAASIVLDGATSGIADFESYDGSADLTTWSFPLGDEVSNGVFTGTFGYGDEADGFPEVFEMGTGNDSEYALRIADTLAEEYGGGMGLWLSECIDASAFSGISFWVRGDGPTGTATLSLLMQETTTNAPATADGTVGTCDGTDAECVPPKFEFPVTDAWTEIQVDWSDFTPGDAAGTSIVPDGSNVWQIQFDIGLVWVGDGDDYTPTPAGYELELDDLTFH